jgi:hypothetical protein
MFHEIRVLLDRFSPLLRVVMVCAIVLTLYFQIEMSKHTASGVSAWKAFQFPGGLDASNYSSKGNVLRRRALVSLWITIASTLLLTLRKWNV